MRSVLLLGLSILLLPFRLLPWLVHDPPPAPEDSDLSAVDWATDRSWVKENYGLMERPTRLGCLLVSGALVGLGALIGYLVQP